MNHYCGSSDRYRFICYLSSNPKSSSVNFLVTTVAFGLFIGKN